MFNTKDFEKSLSSSTCVQNASLVSLFAGTTFQLVRLVGASNSHFFFRFIPNLMRISSWLGGAIGAPGGPGGLKPGGPGGGGGGGPPIPGGGGGGGGAPGPPGGGGGGGGRPPCSMPGGGGMGPPPGR